MNASKAKVVSMRQSSGLRTAKVVDIHNGVSLDWHGSMLSARTAVSCLLQPEVGDKVMLDFDDEGQAYVLAILERSCSHLSTISLPSKTHITAQDTLSIESGKALNLLSKKHSQSSESSVLTTDKLAVKFDQGAVSGKNLHSHVELMHLMSNIISSVASQAIQKFKTYVRKTEESDQVQATHMARQVKGLYNLQSKHSILVSEKDTKIDGEHIHMG